MPQLTLADKFWCGVGMGPKAPHMDTPCWLWTRGHSHGYGAVYKPGRHTPLPAHRVSYQLAFGAIPPKLEVDHRCHNKGCVRPDHLRLATKKQQQENEKPGRKAHNTSGVRGVYWNKKYQKWMAQIGHDGQRIWVGAYDDLGCAESAIVARRKELFTHNDLDRQMEEREQ